MNGYAALNLDLPEPDRPGGRGKQLIAGTPPPQKGCSARGATATLDSVQLDDSVGSLRLLLSPMRALTRARGGAPCACQARVAVLSCAAAFREAAAFTHCA